MRIRRQAPGTYDDLPAALATAESLQATIRLGDAKIASLATVVCGTAVLALERAVPALIASAGSSVRMVGAALVAVTVGGAATAAWHLLSGIWPQVAGPAGENRFGYPNIVESGRLPSSTDAERRRSEAWAHVATLAAIAMRKHVRVRRCLPWIAIELAAGTLSLIVAQVLLNVMV